MAGLLSPTQEMLKQKRVFLRDSLEVPRIANKIHSIKRSIGFIVFDNK